MIFNEIYSAYFNTVAHILGKAVNEPVGSRQIRKIVEKYAFSESTLSIESALAEQKWQLLLPDGTTPLEYSPDIPVTLLQKRWLKAISLDPRIRLFDCDIDLPDDIDPLFTAEDYYIFDKYSDGDPFEDESYIRNFRLILHAITERIPLSVCIFNKNKNEKEFVIMPEYLEYSEKDDKFRLVTSGNRYVSVINLGRVISCEIYEGEFKPQYTQKHLSESHCITMELVDERNALERVMLHFSHFKKRAEKIDDNRYRVKVYYDRSDETEIVIRVLSFGPLVKVTEPRRFVGMIKSRLKQQREID